MVNLSDFNHPSKLHSLGHTVRVMSNACLLLEYFQPPDWFTPDTIEFSEIFEVTLYAAMIHDTARTHDDICLKHGESAALHKLRLLNGYKLDRKQLCSIAKAVRMHSVPDPAEWLPDCDHLVLALLKDADALDRVRLGDLNPDYFRLPMTHKFMHFSSALYQKFPENTINFRSVYQWAIQACPEYASALKKLQQYEKNTKKYR